ncbi:outer membrane receptor protein involved in Fe transport [Maribacter vaceletii]|uniref:Outer membrane receptor protein involved in Fe transport n=1 Tax=Maribacter vaceletii TaxID=1206816 RepID=A0A495DT67_9FLAO|nr:outer membrane beta-barrel family protein [Maribacter vaceletii]RKR07814.1 outer membrane receptor protein involved in Fe transport [Maribacter vaceletii]
MKTSFSYFLLVTFLLIQIGQIQAQNSSVSGTVYDENEEPITFANVLLLQQQDSVLVKGVTSNDQGNYLIENIAAGNYILNISLLGFKPYFKQLQLQDSQEILNGITKLEGQNQELEGVAVVGRKLLYEQKSDRLILNVGSLPTFTGNNALQILQKAPGVIVQENSNSISLNNKGEVLLMINDRISRVPQGVLIQQLKGMRAENIDRIELIHQPGAKYDANNAAGIIHIVLKENSIYGMSGNTSLTVGIGQREKFSGNLDLNFRNDRLNIYANTTGFQNKSPLWSVNHFREYEFEGDQYYYENRLNFTNPTFNSISFNLGADFEIDKNNIIGAVFGFSKSNMSGVDFKSNSTGAMNQMSNTNSQFLMGMDNPNRNSFFNLNYFRKLNPNSSINIDMDRVALDVQNFSGLTFIDLSSGQEMIEANRNSNFEIYTVKADFERKTENGTKLETGVKGTFNNSNTVSQRRTRNSGVWSENTSFRMNDDISETILGAYASYSKKWNEKWESDLGLRLEHYNYELTDAEGNNDFMVTYNNLFPVLRTSYVIDSLNTMTLSFNRRIERPAFMKIAGFNLLIDPSLFVTSNTRIRPSFTNAIRLTYQLRSFLLAVEVNKTRGAISFYNTVDKEQNLQTSTPINFDSMSGVLITMSFPVKVSKLWKMNWNLDGAYKKVKDASNRPLPFEKGVIGVTAQLTNVFELGNSWTANIDGRYMSPFITGDQVHYLRHFVNFGISKKFKNESSLTFSIQDITASSGNIDWEYEQPELGVKTYGNNDFSERVFQVTYSFPFGNQKVKEKRKRVTGSQEERNRM